jgi:hypothetical protein
LIASERSSIQIPEEFDLGELRQLVRPGERQDIERS